MTGWPITIWFRTEREAQLAAQAIGPVIAERFAHDRPYSYADFEEVCSAVRDAFGEPSKALAVGRKETKIPAKRATPWDR